MKRSTFIIAAVALGILSSMSLTACSGVKSERVTVDDLKNAEERRKEGFGKLFGEDTFVFGGDRKKDEAGAGAGLGVNSYLWRASLDTLLFMPVNSADPFGGVIITDWYSPPEAASNERFKLNVYILGRALRADGVKVAVFRQVAQGSDWRDAPVGEDVGVKIEDAILMRARQLRYETQNQ